MALFKISRGGYSNLPTNLTDGWAYFTPDNKGFYIDTVGNINGKSFNKRIKINDRVETIYHTLSTSKWSNKTYTLLVPLKYIDGTYCVEINVVPAGSIDEQFVVTAASAKANISYTLDIDNARVFIVANGTQPTVDIPISVKFIPTESSYVE